MRLPPIIVRAAYTARNRLFQRCAWCGGWSTKANPVQVHSTEGQPSLPGRPRWWWSVPGCYHSSCMLAKQRDSARRSRFYERRGYLAGYTDATPKEAGDVGEAEGADL